MLLQLCVIFVLTSIVSSASTTRILGGSDAQVGQFPYQVSLQDIDYGEHICGGAILNEHFILTAAHCVVVGEGIETLPTKYFRIRIGSIQRSAGGLLRTLKSITVHPNYKFYWYDLAVLQLEGPLTWTANIKPIELASAELLSGENVIVSGWGLSAIDGFNPHRMQWTALEARRTEQCDFDDSILCLAHDVGSGICNGDAGGPATNASLLVGIGSFIVNDCGSTNPDGYTKVAYHRDWILEQIKV